MTGDPTPEQAPGGEAEDDAAHSEDMFTPEPARANVFGILAVCALVFGAALLFVARNAGEAGSTTLFSLSGYAALLVAVVLAVPAAVAHRNARDGR